MDAKTGNGANNTNDFEPSFDLIQEEDCNTLVVYLPGFTKEQLRVQLTKTRILKISGTRPLGNNRWSSFQKDFPVSENCDTKKISAKFEDGVLYVRYVRQPKLIVPADQTKKTPETPLPHDHKHATLDEPRPAPKTIDQPTTTKTTPTSTHHDTNQTSHVDPKKETPRDMGKEKIVDNKVDASTDKKEAEPDMGKEKIVGSEKHGGVYADKKVGAGSKLDATRKLRDYINKVKPETELKMAKEKMNKILLLLFVFVLGMFVSKLPWIARKTEN